MTKFIVTYHASPEAIAQMRQSTPEQMKEGMKPWMDWAQKCGAGLVDMGSPFGEGQKVTASGAALFENDVVGYSVLQAENMAGALTLLEGHPHLGWHAGCEIVVHETKPMPA